MPPLPALQVRVPNSANALLAAEPVLRGRAERNALAQQEQRRGQIGNLLSADLTDPTVRQQVQSKAFAIDPQAGAQIQTMFRQMSAEERANTERDAQTLSRAFFGVNDQASFDAARSALPEHLQEGVGTVFQREGVQAIVQGGLAVSDLFRRETAQLPTPPLSGTRQNQLLELAEAQRSGGSGFSLSPGQTRFDAAGNPLASVPASGEANTVTLSPGSRVVNTDTGAVIAENPAAAPTPPRPVTLSPGQALLDTNGAVIAERPSAPGRPLALSPGQALVSPTGAPLARGPEESRIPRTDLGRIRSDLNAGLTTPAQALLQTQQALAPSEQWRPSTPEERQAVGIPEGQGAQTSTTSGKISTVGRGGGITLYDAASGNIIAQVGGAPLTNRQIGSQGIEIAEEIRSTNTRLSELNSALTSLQANPQAAGLSGIAIERIGGVAEQVANLTGVDGDWLGTAPVQETRTQLSSLLGQYIPTITGDESGRYSDRDVQRAEAALPATRATASFQQVQSSLLTLQDIERRARGRALMRLDGFAPNVDITYPAGQLSYARQLQREGKSFEEAGNIVADLLLKYDLPLEIVGIQ